MSRVSAVLDQSVGERRAKVLADGPRLGQASRPFERRPTLMCCRRCTVFVAVVLDGVQCAVVLLDPEPVADGEFVLFEEHAQPCAVPHVAAEHDGWRRWRRHVCKHQGDRR